MSTVTDDRTGPTANPDPNRSSEARKPNAGRFAKGRSGNPKGRPRRSPPRAPGTSPLAILMDQTIAINHGDRTHAIPVQEALMHRIYRDAVAGKAMPIREVVKWILEREAWFAKREIARSPELPPFMAEGDPENADEAMVLLGIAAPSPIGDGVKPARLRFETWSIQAAFDRMRRSGETISNSTADCVKRGTRDPQSLIWPDRSV